MTRHLLLSIVLVLVLVTGAGASACGSARDSQSAPPSLDETFAMLANHSFVVTTMDGSREVEEMVFNPPESARITSADGSTRVIIGDQEFVSNPSDPNSDEYFEVQVDDVLPIQSLPFFVAVENVASRAEVTGASDRQIEFALGQLAGEVVLDDEGNVAALNVPPVIHEVSQIDTAPEVKAPDVVLPVGTLPG